jgi:D-threo-aldose 1-dehydrogenase
VDPAARRHLGTTGVQTTQLGFGGAAIGELNRRVSEAESLAAFQVAWSAGIRYFDTAPLYGRGMSELRTGAGLRAQKRDDYVLSTKVGRWLRPTRDMAAFDREGWVGGLPMEYQFDYSYDGIMRSWEQSAQRLGATRADVLVVHDLDHGYHGTGERFRNHLDALARSGWRALEELRSGDMARAVIAGMNHEGMVRPLLDVVPLDGFLVAMPYTLIAQDVLEDEFPYAISQGCGLVIGSPFATGILATGTAAGDRYNYRRAPADILERVAAIERVCVAHEVHLVAAALQFPLGHPAVASVIPGMSGVEQVRRNVEAFSESIPAAFWEELKARRLIREDAPVPVAELPIS